MQLRTKESDLLFATFMYIARCVEEGDWPRLRQMGFGEEEVQALRSMSLEELAAMRQNCASFTQISVNRSSFWLHVRLARQRAADRYRMMQMIKLGAPAEMLAELYGVDAKEYASMRAVLGAEGEGVGRPPEPDEEAHRRISEAWDMLWRDIRSDQGLGEDEPADHTRLKPQHWIDIAEISGQPLRVVWKVVRHWLSAGAARSDWPGQAEQPRQAQVACVPRDEAGLTPDQAELPANVVALPSRLERGGERA